MSGKKHRQKGDRLEREIVTCFQEAGLEAKRVPLSGSADGFKGDVQVTQNHAVLLPASFPGEKHYSEWSRIYTGECKSRKFLPKYYAEWLRDADFVVMKADRQKPMILLDFDTFAELLGGGA